VLLPLPEPPSLVAAAVRLSPCCAATAPLSQHKLAASGERRTNRSCGRPRTLLGTCPHHRGVGHRVWPEEQDERGGASKK
jgi:hypothetical protein